MESPSIFHQCIDRVLGANGMESPSKNNSHEQVEGSSVFSFFGGRVSSSPVRQTGEQVHDARARSCGPLESGPLLSSPPERTGASGHRSRASSCVPDYRISFFGGAIFDNGEFMICSLLIP